MTRTLLVVDDIATNRVILKKILGTEYAILEAANGQEAVTLLQRHGQTLSAVLLDLAMPVMDGFQLLERMRGSAEMAHIPVIVTTGTTDEASEVRALTLGANDYITKPYNSTIIRQRIRNTINLRETAAANNILRRDRLTGLFNREVFFQMVEEMIAGREPGYYTMSSFDIDNFKVINDQYGTEKGDGVLRHIADCLNRWAEPIGGLCCRVMADNFAVVYPTAFTQSDTLKACHQAMCAPVCLDRAINICIGRYTITDLSLSASAIYDRVTMAETSIKGKYDAYIAQYDETMRTRLLREQEIVNEMNEALAEGQFEVWFQPQINHATGALIGAEGLARWRHPTKGMISPAEFIPVFERNGFIYELDKYVWELACRHLRQWTDQGRNPMPVSVNISRYDLFQDGLMDALTGILQKHRIAPEMLHLEITESAFAQSAEKVIGVVEEMLKAGFTVEIDDFGSGYSSLNTLKDVPASILKLDMRFLRDGVNSDRGGNIIESVVRMAKWLGMPVIAEGVETVEQADYLKSIGCYYVQGFLYARPMPPKQYEAFSGEVQKERQRLRLETVENLDTKAFWDPKSMDTLIFNSYVGGACIFEYHHGRMELLRINDNYVRELGCGLSAAEAYGLNITRYMNGKDKAVLVENIEHAIETGEESSCEVLLTGLGRKDSRVWIRTTVRAIARVDARYLLYCSIFNMTALRESEQKARDSTKRLLTMEQLLDNLPCGAGWYRQKGDSLQVVHLNRRYGELVARALSEPAKDAAAVIHPEDREAIKAEWNAALAEKRDFRHALRLRWGSAGDRYRRFQVDARTVDNEDGTRSIFATFSPE